MIDPIRGVEFFRLGEMADIAGVQHEARLLRQCLGLADGPLQCARNILVGPALKPIWLSLIWKKVKSAALPRPPRADEADVAGTPAETVQSMPVPIQPTHSMNLRREGAMVSSSFCMVVVPYYLVTHPVPAATRLYSLPAQKYFYRPGRIIRPAGGSFFHPRHAAGT